MRKSFTFRRMWHPVAAAAAAALAAGGCVTTRSASQERMFSAGELEAAVRVAEQEARASTPGSAGFSSARLRAALQSAIRKAYVQGYHAGRARAQAARPAPVSRPDPVAAPKAVPAQPPRPTRDAARAREAVETFRGQAARDPLLGGRKLREDKARTILSRQVLDMVSGRLEQNGYRVVLAVPTQVLSSVRQADEAKVSVSMSPEFNVDFARHFERMTLLDGLGLLNKMYDFSFWVGHDGKTVWIGYPSSAPDRGRATRLGVHFDEGRFLPAVTR